MLDHLHSNVFRSCNQGYLFYFAQITAHRREVLTPVPDYICNNAGQCPKFRLLKALGIIVNEVHG